MTRLDAGAPGPVDIVDPSAVGLTCGPVSELAETSRRYHLIEHIASGGQAEIYRGSRPDPGGQGPAVTVRILRPDQRQDPEEEIRAWEAGDAVLMDLTAAEVPGIARRLDGFFGYPPTRAATPSGPLLPYQICEYLPGVDLARLLRDPATRTASSPKVDAGAILRRLAELLRLMHQGVTAGQRPVLHMDVKPANLMVLDPTTVRLIDFTGARYWGGERIERPVYTPEFSGPEVSGGSDRIGPAYDVHGFGGVAFWLVTGRAPRRPDGQGGWRLHRPKLLRRHPAVAELLLSMLDDQPDRRPRTEELPAVVDELVRAMDRAAVGRDGVDWEPAHEARTRRRRARESEWAPVGQEIVELRRSVDRMLAASVGYPPGRDQRRWPPGLRTATGAEANDEVERTTRGPRTRRRPRTEPVRGTTARPAPPDEPAPAPRVLLAELPERSRVATEFSLVLQIALDVSSAVQRYQRLKPYPIAEDGSRVTIVVAPSGALRATTPLEQSVLVRGQEDSELVRFAFQASTTGLVDFHVSVWVGGTFLGEMRLRTSIEETPPTEELRPHSVPLGALRADPGEATLQVRRNGDRYVFQLLSAPYLFEPVEARLLTASPGEAVERVVTVLRRIAEGESGYDGANTLAWMSETGIGLWRDLVPDAVKEQFWTLRDSISSFSIACNDDTVPWELMYPLARGHDAGFLVEQFPVLRRVFAQRRAARVNLGESRFVVPPGSPANAAQEVAAIRAVLGGAGSAPESIAELSMLLALINRGDFGLLHFACHNAFHAGQGGSRIAMDGGAFVPTLLNRAVATASLEESAPLVFLNACRTAGAVPEYTRTMGWAGQFMAAGAGAFVGTLWPVRSSAAGRFAEAFYHSLSAGQTLGTATHQARTATRVGTDSTWLAYSVYGDPAATAQTALEHHW